MRDKAPKVRKFFLQGGTLTVRTCTDRFKTTELRCIVPRLIEKGYIFVRDERGRVGEWVVNLETGDRYKEYWLDRKAKQPEPMNIKYNFRNLRIKA